MNSPQDVDTDSPQPPPSPGLASDRLITIADIRMLFGLGRTAAYELTHRPDFPEHVPVSPRCYRWWASEVETFAAALRSKGVHSRVRRTAKPRLPPSPSTPGRISGTVRTARPGRKEAS